MAESVERGGQNSIEAPEAVVSTPHSETCAAIKAFHRQARHAIKLQSINDRSLEAFIRVNLFGFSTVDEEKVRNKKAKAAGELITQIRKGQCPDEYSAIIPFVMASDGAREPWDQVRKTAEKEIARLAKTLPGFRFVESILGFGVLGFAQIIGETGDLSGYANVAKLWKRLGFAPYNGHAMSSWKREAWRKDWGEKPLSAEEWIANPFAPQRYALMFMIAESLFKHQTMRQGPYRAIYDKRRSRTKETHPDWTDMHSHRDAMRIMMKELLKGLWAAWHKDAAILPMPTSESLPRPFPSSQGYESGPARARAEAA